MLHIKAPAQNILKTKQLSVPGSKYLANRLGVLALLADGESSFSHFPESDDMTKLLNAIHFFGGKTRFETTKDNARILKVQGAAAAFQNDAASTQKSSKQGILNEEKGKKREIDVLYTGDSGTLSRFIVPVAALCSRAVYIDASPQMRLRPMGKLFRALQELQAAIHCQGVDGYLPAKIHGPLAGGDIELERLESSQYISGLLMAAPYMQNPVRIRYNEPLVSAPYVNMTIEAMQNFAVRVEKEKGAFFIPNKQYYKAREYAIEGDPVAASYFYVLALLTQSKISVQNINAHSLQGEAAFPELLRQSGADISFFQKKEAPAGLSHLSLAYPKQSGMKAIQADFNHMPDVVPSAAVLAALFQEKSVFKNIAHLRYKESNRIDDLASELRKAGLKTQSTKDSLAVWRDGPLRKKPRLNSHADHRLAMALSLLATMTSEIFLEQAESVEKSFPHYFSVLKDFGFQIEKVSPLISPTLNKKAKTIIFIGYRATGKSSFARRLAKHTGKKLVSTDALFEKQSGQSISAFLSKHDWPAFRKIEAQIVHTLWLDSFDGIIDCGGGVVENDQSMQKLSSLGYIVWIDSQQKHILHRLKTKKQNIAASRPALSHLPLEKEVTETLKRRRPLYTSYAALHFKNIGFFEESYATLYAILQKKLDL